MMDIKKVWVTPDEAVDILTKNTHNRPLSPNLVKRLRRDMDSGRWDENTAETIKISRDGELLDGQHRLVALSESSLKGTHFWIAYDVPVLSQEYMDIGKTRSVQDVLRLRHPEVKNLPIVAAICRWLAAVPDLGDDVVFGSRIKMAGITVHEMVDVFESSAKEIQQAAAEGHRFSGVVRAFPPSVVAYCWFQIERVDRGAASEFFGAMKSLSFDHEEDPRKAVYDKAQKLYQDPNIPNGSKEHSASLASIITRGYNLWASGERVKYLTLATSTGKFLEPVAPIKRVNHD